MNRFGSVEERSEIAFFDLETSNPKVTGQECLLLEFGAILVCPRTLEEIDHYDTLVKPPNLSIVPESSFRGNTSGITRNTVSDAPTFPEIADKVYDILHGRIWAGHFIAEFDCVHIRRAFAEIGRPAPEPKGIIDSVPLLRRKGFDRRAGNVKLARLAEYFKLGKQTHRSLDDVRMNLKVIKYCSTVLFLESSLPDMLSINSLVSPNATSSGDDQEESASSDCYEIEDPNLVRQDTSEVNPLDMDILIDQIAPEPVQSEAERRSPIDSPCCDGYLEPEQILVPSLKAALVPTLDRGQRIKLVNELHLRCAKLKLCYQVSTTYWPRLSICVQSPPSLCQVLEHCDYLARKFLMDSGSSSKWRPVVNTSMNPPTIRLHIPTTNVDSPIYSTEMYKKEASGTTQKLKFSKVDVNELNCLFIRGILIDAFFSLDGYDSQQNAGLLLVAEKLIINS